MSSSYFFWPGGLHNKLTDFMRCQILISVKFARNGRARQVLIVSNFYYMAAAKELQIAVKI